jgi:hypothetical protein
MSSRCGGGVSGTSNMVPSLSPADGILVLSVQSWVINPRLFPSVHIGHERSGCSPARVKGQATYVGRGSVKHARGGSVDTLQCQPFGQVRRPMSPGPVAEDSPSPLVGILPEIPFHHRCSSF